jgi:tetratricopeptide (TPR) repeat protein
VQLSPGTAIDRYVVEGLLGRGGMASVYRVRHEGLGTVHALKVVHVPSPSVTERLLREGRVQGTLRHPNVAAVTDLVTVRGSPGLVMELVPGPPLEQLLRKIPLSLEEADVLARGILAGASAAHRAGLVHRDLKPGNVLVEVQDGQIIPKIVDFGLAKALVAAPDSPVATRAGVSMGTPAYMAPEQIDDASAVDERADVFALGAILFELVMGERAFQGDTVPEVYARIRAGEYTAVANGVPERMRRAIDGALAVDPRARTRSVEELARQWGEETPLPHVEWTEYALQTATVRVAVTPVPETPPNTSTMPPQVTRTTQETFAVEDFELTSTVDGPPPAAARTRAGVWPWVGGAVLLALGLSAWLWLGGGTEAIEATQFTIDGPPMLSEGATQRQLEESWEAYLKGDFAEAERRLRSVREAVPEQPLPHLLAGSALFFLGDVPSGLDAMTAARTSAAADPSAPGAGLVEVYRQLQLQGVSVGPLLDGWIETHPEDYLAKVMRAQYCSTTSDAVVCDASHAALLAHSDEPVVAHLARARSWLDLGELARVREATAAGLAIDPQEPGLLDMEGRAWMAEGAFEEAKASFERANQADPRRRGPKVALSQLAILLDDGTWPTLTAELLAPTVPSGERVEVYTEAAEALHGLGRAKEALAHLDRAEVIEREEGSPLGVLTVLSKRSPIYRSQGRKDLLSELISEQIALIGGSPEIPNPVRNRYASYRPWMDGLLAAENGDREGVVRALERLGAGEYSLVGLKEELRRELAILDGDASVLVAHATSFWTPCARQSALGDAYRRVGALEQAEQQWQALLEGTCRLHRPERGARVGALVGLAELTEDPEERAAWVTEARGLWPRPDEELPLAARLRALEP